MLANNPNNGANGAGPEADSPADAAPTPPLAPLVDREFIRAHVPYREIFHATLDGRPVGIYKVSNDPFLALVNNVVSPEEAAAFIAGAESRLERSVAIDYNGRVAAEVRTSSTAFMDKAESEVVRTVERRSAILAGLPATHGESLQVVRYLPGEKFDYHADAYPMGRNIETLNVLLTGGQRAVTVLIYLNDLLPNDDGGLTHFIDPSLNTTVKPRLGTAVVFENILPNGSPDLRSLHAGLAPKTSVKYAINAWFRERPWRLPPTSAEEVVARCRELLSIDPRVRKAIEALNPPKGPLRELLRES